MKASAKLSGIYVGILHFILRTLRREKSGKYFGKAIIKMKGK
jgi:hypothetical protein